MVVVLESVIVRSKGGCYCNLAVFPDPGSWAQLVRAGGAKFFWLLPLVFGEQLWRSMELVSGKKDETSTMATGRTNRRG